MYSLYAWHKKTENKNEKNENMIKILSYLQSQNEMIVNYMCCGLCSIKLWWGEGRSVEISFQMARKGV